MFEIKTTSKSSCFKKLERQKPFYFKNNAEKKL